MAGKQNKLLIISLLVLFLLIGIVTYLIKNNPQAFKIAKNPRIKGRELETNSAVVEEHIISLVGKDYFEENYRLLPEESYICQDYENFKTYCISYEYLPASQISGEQITVGAQVRHQKLLYKTGLPNCLEDKTRCQFNITKEQAIAIAKEQGFFQSGNKSTIHFTLSEDSDRWVWRVTEKAPIQPKDPMCGSNNVIEINSSNGETSLIREEGWCI